MPRRPPPPLTPDQQSLAAAHARDAVRIARHRLRIMRVRVFDRTAQSDRDLWAQFKDAAIDALFNAVRHYDITRLSRLRKRGRLVRRKGAVVLAPVKFTTYLYTAVRNSAIKVFEFRSADKRVLEYNRTRPLTDILVDDLRAARPAPQPDPVPQLDAIFRVLPSRSADIVRMLFGIGCEPMNLTAIGRRIGVTKTRVRQLFDAAMARLRLAAARAQVGGAESISP